MPALITWWSQDVAVLSPEADPRLVYETGTDLLQRRARPLRTFHTTTHLVEVFWALTMLQVAGEIGERDAAVGRVAAWFHDVAVENRSDVEGHDAVSDLAVLALARLGLAGDDIAAVEALIRVGSVREVPRPDGLIAAFWDADRWIWSAPADRFDESCEELRAESATMSERGYGRARSRVVIRALSGPRVYATAFAHSEWTEQARANLSRELARLPALT